MKHFTRLTLAIITLLAIIPSNCLATTNYTIDVLNAQEEILVNLIAEDRISAGLPVLPLDKELCRIAQIKADEMISENYFSHVSPTYGNIRSMLTYFGVDYKGASENIARSRDVYHADAAFLSSSSGHRTTLLGGQWTRMGVAVSTNSRGFVYVVEIFAR